MTTQQCELVSSGPRGIGGWLLLPVLHLIVDIGWFVAISVGVAKAAEEASKALSAGEWAAVGVYLFDGLVAIYAFICLIQLFRKKSYVPTMMIVFYVLVVTKALADAAALTAYPDLVSDPNAVFQDWMSVVRAVIAAVVWISYFRISVRVENTFNPEIRCPPMVSWPQEP